ncbi:MAG: N-6 DNA methylase [Alistipes sp.]|nr:N-6 DNA methylase [Alistipes sp.]
MAFFNSKQHLSDNLEAIGTAFELKNSGAVANERQLHILSKYSGFGGLPYILYPVDTNMQKKEFIDDPNLIPILEILYKTIEENSSDHLQYRKIVDNLRASVLTSFYTPGPIVSAMIDAVKSTGIQVNDFLDPAAGTGIFSKYVQTIYPASTRLNIEQDILTSLILSHLRPDDFNRMGIYENLEPQFNDHFDFVASNIPFGNHRVFDGSFTNIKDKAKNKSLERIHNYYFIKAIDSVRDGGLIAFLTTRAVLDTPGNDLIRKYIAEKCNFISAVRMPDNLFTAHSGTSAGTDIVILQKNSGKKYNAQRDKKITQLLSYKNQTYYNRHFWESQNVIYTSRQEGTNQYGKPAIKYLHAGTYEEIASETKRMLVADLNQYFDKELYTSIQKEPNSLIADFHKAKDQIVVEEKVRISKQSDSFLVRMGLVDSQTDSVNELIPFTGDLPVYPKEGMMVNYNGEIGVITNLKSSTKQFTPLKLSNMQKIQAEIYLDLRDAYRNLFFDEADNEKENEGLRKELNNSYNTFHKHFGNLNDRDNVKMILFDTCGREVLSLERFKDGEKKLADIFHHPVNFKVEEIIHTDNTVDAFALCLDKFADFNLSYITDLTGKSEATVIDELRGRIFFDPSKNKWEISERFLAGNIYEKIEQLNAVKDQYTADSPFDDSMQALINAIPKPIPFNQLDINFGERWLPMSIYNEFASELFQVTTRIEYNQLTDQFYILPEKENALINEKLAVKASSGTIDGVAIMGYAFNDTIPDLTKTILIDGKQQKVTDFEKMDACLNKVTQMREAFEAWHLKRPGEVKQNIVDIYNRKFNAQAIPEYDGSHLSLSDLNLENLGYDEIRPNQKNAVWMCLLNQGGIIDHKVGGGKTLIGCIAAHEMNRLKLRNKVVMLCLKANVDKVATEYMLAYPNDRLLYPSEDDFKPENRERLFYDMMNNDWSAIIMTHEQFGKIRQPLDVQYAVLMDELDSVDRNLQQWEEDNQSEASPKMVKGLQIRKKNLISKIADVNYQMEKRRDDTVDFDKMGIDHIIVDESHIFKNCPFNTRHTMVSGLGNPTGSQRALNMLYSIRYLQDKYDCDLQATFMSGTTISNSLSEKYILHKYLRPRALEKQGLKSFDAWIATYARKSREFEVDVTGRIVLKERFRYFIKVPELSRFYREITNYFGNENKEIAEPDIEYKVHLLEPTPEQLSFRDDLIKFAVTGDAKYLGLDEISDSQHKAKMLIATSYANKMAVDMRLIDAGLYHDHPNNKATVCAQNIAESYHRHQGKANQLLFCDLGTYKKDEWNVYSEIKRKLIQDHGFKPTQIRFIQETSDAVSKSNMVDAFNQRQIQILMGSTSTLGTGVNGQVHTSDVHNLDIPWRFTDLEQRDARGARPGNKFAPMYSDNKVISHIYASKLSLDSYKFNLVHLKKMLVRQLKDGTITDRTIDEGAISGAYGVDFDHFIGELTENPDLIEKSKVEARIKRLLNERSTFHMDRYSAEIKLEATVEDINRKEGLIGDMKSDLELFSKETQSVVQNFGLKVKDENCQNPHQLSKELNRLSRETDTKGQYFVVGSVYGFDVVLHTRRNIVDDSKQNRFFVRSRGNSGYMYSYNHGQIATSDPILTISNFHKALETIPQLIDNNKRKLNDMISDRKILQAIVDNSDWLKEEQYKQEKENLAALDKRLKEAIEKREKSILKEENTVGKTTTETKQISLTSR